MIHKKYRSVLTICLAGIWLFVFRPKLMAQYFPGCFSAAKEVKYYCFCKHYWLPKTPADTYYGN